MSSQGLTFKDLRNAILFAAFIYLVVVFIHDIIDVILIFSITALLVVSLNPFVTWLEKHRVPRAAGTPIVIISLVILTSALIYFLAPIAARQVSELARQLPDLISRLGDWFSKISRRYPTLDNLGQHFNLSSVQQFIRPFVGGIGQATSSGIYVIASIIVILVTTIYSLINPKPLIDGFVNALDPKRRPRALAAGERLSTQIKAWARGTIYAMFTIFFLTWLALHLLGFKQALLFAVIAGILEIVPVIGPILSAVPPLIVALVTDPVLALWVVGSFVLIQQFENHVLIPMVMSRQVRLHPVTVIFWVLAMGALFGLVGIFLATPAGVAAGVLYDELYLCEYRKICRESLENEEKTAE